MKVIVTSFAQQQINETADYIRREFDRSRMSRFLQKVRETRRLLADNPYLGPIESILSEKQVTYRYVVVDKLNKMVYYIENEKIIIADFWDCRREPAALANQVN